MYFSHTQIHTCTNTHTHTAVKDMLLSSGRRKDFLLVCFLLSVYLRRYQQTFPHISLARVLKSSWIKPVAWSGNVAIRMDLDQLTNCLLMQIPKKTGVLSCSKKERGEWILGKQLINMCLTYTVYLCIGAVDTTLGGDLGEWVTLNQQSPQQPLVPEQRSRRCLAFLSLRTVTVRPLIQGIIHSGGWKKDPCAAIYINL